MTDKLTEDAIKNMFIPGEVCLRRKSTWKSDLLACLITFLSIAAVAAVGLWKP